MPKGLQRGLAALVIVPALYALLGFLALPWAGLTLVNQQLAKYARVPASLERIEFNPFSLELTLHNLRLGEPGNEQLAFARLYANLQGDSLWRRELHLLEVRLERPQVQLRLATDGHLDLLQLFDLPSPPGKPAQAPSRPFPVRLDQLTLDDGALQFADERIQPVPAFRYDDIALELRNLTSHTAEAAELALRASGPDGAALDWQGRLGLQPLHSQGRLSLGETALPRWWPYVQAFLPLQLQEGTASLSSDYLLESQAGLRLQLNNPKLQLGALKLLEADGRPLLDLDALTISGSRLDLRPGPQLQLQLDAGQLQLAALQLYDPARQPQLRLERLNATDTRVDLGERRVTIGQLRSQGLKTRVIRASDGRLDWQALVERQLRALREHRARRRAGAPSAVAAETGSTSADSAQEDGKQRGVPSSQALRPWLLSLPDVQLRDWRASLEDRAVQPAVPLEIGPLDLDLQDLSSLGSQPFRFRLASAIAPRGRLEASGQATLKPFASQFKVQARELDLRPLQAYISPFVHLELRSGHLGADLQVALQRTTPLVLSIDGRAGVSQLHTLDTLKGRDFVRWQRLDLTGLAYRHGEQLHIDRVHLQQPYARFIINEDLSTNVKELLIAQPRKAAPATPERPLHVRIGGVEIRDGSANFADFSLTPNFATAMQQLSGRIGTLDNRSGKSATLDIRGKVDRYAPVSIRGHLTPFSPLEQLDIATRFQRVELTTLTPYAGKFAGYKIRKGRLNLDLHYRIDKGRLDADNKVLLEDLQLGERVDSPSATDLPVRLAVALLKDTDGNIDIALPVQGDLNNPEFSVLPIVWQTLHNLMLRATQAPFKMIAGLLEGDGDPLDSVTFSAGSSALDEKAHNNLGKLAKALQQRQALRLEVEGMSLPAIDGTPLAEQRLHREYQDSWYRMLQRRGAKVPAEASQLDVPEDMQAPLLEGIYRARLKRQPPAEWAALKKPERSARLRQAVLDSWAQSPLLLRQLAQDRARAIKAWLVEQGGLADARIYLLEVGNAGSSEAAGGVAVPLHLDSE